MNRMARNVLDPSRTYACTRTAVQLCGSQGLCTVYHIHAHPLLYGNVLTQESEYDRRMIVVNPDRALPFGCRNYHVLKSDYIQLTSYRWNNLLRVASLGREVSVRNLEFWSNRSFVSSTAHSLNLLHNWISNLVAGFWAALSINDFDDWLQCISSSTELISGSKIITWEFIVLELVVRLS